MNSLTEKLVVVAASVLIFAALAQAYSDPPSWSPMTMVRVSFNPIGADGRVDYTQPATTNLVVEAVTARWALGYATLTAAPGAFDAATETYDPSVVSFDPAQPWSVLNGTAYSRRLGWYDGKSSNFYATFGPAGAGILSADQYIWIEKIDGSPEVSTYEVSFAGNPTSPYTPIFGTLDPVTHVASSTKWLWGGFMDHNVNAVDLTALTQPNQVFTQTYHIYVGNSSGAILGGFGDATTTWTWQGPAVAFPEPATVSLLAIGGGLLLRMRKRRPA